MDRRAFLEKSLAAAGGAFAGRRLLSAENSQETRSDSAAHTQAPGATARSEIEAALFPDGFLCGTATAAFQV